jgi:hypothetical protein
MVGFLMAAVAWACATYLFPQRAGFGWASLAAMLGFVIGEALTLAAGIVLYQDNPGRAAALPIQSMWVVLAGTLVGACWSRKRRRESVYGIPFRSSADSRREEAHDDVERRFIRLAASTRGDDPRRPGS